MIVRLINKLLQPAGLTIQPYSKSSTSLSERFPDIEPQYLAIIEKCLPYTMTYPERMYGLCKAIEYIHKSQIKGDIVECGVWKGGSSMCAMYTSIYFNDVSRNVYMYDTFEGMSEPTDKDQDLGGLTATEQLKQQDKSDQRSVWCYSALDEVKANVALTGYPASNIKFIKGKVEETIPEHIPDNIALLRLDTDWFESTNHEMKYLFPKLVKGGVIIIDDYGHWKGARDAVDMYFKENNIHILLNRLDYTGRIGIK
jgi:O-methyltransferase